MAQTLRAGSRPGAQATPVHPRKSGRRPAIVEFYGSAVGKKWAMALTGIGLMGFVFAHMVGNLKMYLGVETSGPDAGRYAIDVYGETLRKLAYPLAPEESVLWLMRFGLLLMVAIHIHAAVSLTLMNKRSRPVGYQSPRDYVAVTFASRTMRMSGLIIFAYILFHLADLTLGWANPDFRYGEVQHNLITSLGRPPVAIIYVIANILLAVHLFHGAWSLFQSIGLNNPRFNAARKTFAVGFASIVGIGNSLFPILILAGVVK